MNKHYLVSIIECAEEEENNFFTDFRLFANKERAEEYYANNLNNFLSEKRGYEWYDEDEERTSTYHRNTYTWESGADHWEIQLTEL